MFDQLPHVGIAIHLAELTVEEPISMSLSPGRVKEKKEVKSHGFQATEQTFKTAPSRKRVPKTGKNLCEFGKVSQKNGKSDRRHKTELLNLPE